MRKLLLVVVQLALVAGCTIPRRPSMEAPRRARHHYHHRQRQHERERRHYPHQAWQSR